MLNEEMRDPWCAVLSSQSVPTNQYVFIHTTEISSARLFVYHLQNFRQERDCAFHGDPMATVKSCFFLREKQKGLIITMKF